MSTSGGYGWPSFQTDFTKPDVEELEMLALIDKQKLFKPSPAGALFEYKSNRGASEVTSVTQNGVFVFKTVAF